jgi:hypothetical protein
MNICLQKDITTLTMLYVNFELERFEQYMIAMQKIQASFVQDFEFEEDFNYKDYLQWGELKLKVAFQLGSMGVNNLPIEGRLVSQRFICCTRR